MFLDEYELKAVGGKGGDGCCSFRREKYAPRGGPDGGDGGRGGDVVFMPTIHRNTLYHLGGARQYEAEKGRQGTSADCSGRKGADLVLVLTDWPEYGELDWPRLAKASRGKSVFDGRNVVDQSACEAAGMTYVAIGR